MRKIFISKVIMKINLQEMIFSILQSPFSTMRFLERVQLHCQVVGRGWNPSCSLLFGANLHTSGSHRHGGGERDRGIGEAKHNGQKKKKNGLPAWPHFKTAFNTVSFPSRAAVKSRQSIPKKMQQIQILNSASCVVNEEAWSLKKSMPLNHNPYSVPNEYRII